MFKKFSITFVSVQQSNTWKLLRMEVSCRTNGSESLKERYTNSATDLNEINIIYIQLTDSTWRQMLKLEGFKNELARAHRWP